mmetsp:Transcript_1755/g.6119  ORF Transcript_1755/g.6119 Transcript_1755/m.6119 type:complete len:244 (+) Transcript_1755:192-923(+)
MFPPRSRASSQLSCTKSVFFSMHVPFSALTSPQSAQHMSSSPLYTTIGKTMKTTSRVSSPSTGSAASHRSLLKLGRKRNAGKSPQSSPPRCDQCDVVAESTVMTVTRKFIRKALARRMRRSGLVTVSKLRQMSATNRPKMPKHEPDAPATSVHGSSNSAEKRLPPTPEMRHSDAMRATPYFCSRCAARDMNRRVLLARWENDVWMKVDVSQRYHFPALSAGPTRPPHSFRNLESKTRHLSFPP